MKKFFENEIRPWFFIFNLDVVNAKTGKVLKNWEKFLNTFINVIASVAILSIFIVTIIILFYYKVIMQKSLEPIW